MNELWERALDDLRGRLSSENFDTWLAPVQCVGIEDETVTLRIPNRFFQDWLSAHYLDLILETLGRETQSALKIAWEIDEGLQERVVAPPRSPEPVVARIGRASQPGPRTSADLNPKYKFDSFVVGPSNQLAHAASVAAGAEPGQALQPALHLRRCRSRQDPPRQRHRAPHPRGPTRRRGSCTSRPSASRTSSSGRSRTIASTSSASATARAATSCSWTTSSSSRAASRRRKSSSTRSTRSTTRTARSSSRPTSTRSRSPRWRSGSSAASSGAWSPTSRRPSSIPASRSSRRRRSRRASTLSSDVALFIAQVVKSNVRELEGTLHPLAVKAELLKRADRSRVREGDAPRGAAAARARDDRRGHPAGRVRVLQHPPRRPQDPPPPPRGELPADGRDVPRAASASARATPSSATASAARTTRPSSAPCARSTASSTRDDGRRATAVEAIERKLGL